VRVCVCVCVRDDEVAGIVLWPCTDETPRSISSCSATLVLGAIVSRFSAIVFPPASSAPTGPECAQYVYNIMRARKKRSPKFDSVTDGQIVETVRTTDSLKRKRNGRRRLHRSTAELFLIIITVGGTRTRLGCVLRRVPLIVRPV